ncbi:hypothetical protein V6N12_062592 [Hibiscus sabdariffa]|uniref:RNase H type-1 domain-containing protein n=1 Tax=Hibiscus sabdariffa TaxID=183260 RepID=A0ABR2F9B0_9ROSI
MCFSRPLLDRDIIHLDKLRDLLREVHLVPGYADKIVWTHDASVKKVWQIAFGAALWSIWLARCDMYFNGKLISVNELLFLSKIRALFWLKAGKEDWNFDLEVWWQNPSSIISAGLTSANAFWCPPVRGYFKFNIGGARLGPKVGCGGALRDETGALRALFAGPVAVSDLNVAKLLAVKFALELFCETSLIGKVGLLVEVDSQVVLNWVSTLFTRPWRWWPQSIAIDLLTKRIGKVDFNLVDRQRNALAFGLSRDGALRASFFKVWW